MNDPIDLLQVKIERAKEKLPPEAVRAIESVDWKGVIFGMREKKGYSFEQLESLELETELVLCGLLNPASYLKEVEHRMGITRTQAESLVNEMNELVFKKIREELMKNSEKQDAFRPMATPKITPLAEPTPKIVPKIVSPVEIKQESSQNNDILKSAGIEIMSPELESGKQSLLANKLSTSFKIPTAKTEYTLGNLSSSPINKTVSNNITPKIDPYRETPE